MNKEPTASPPSGNAKSKINWNAWGRLLRLPNLFTVPGDAVAGAALAGGLFTVATTVSAGGSVLLLYVGGLLLNDYFDAETDRNERPERPIPSGSVNPNSVLAAGMGALASGIVLAWLGAGTASGLAALCLAMLVLAYDAGKKHLKWCAILLMGACRGGSILVGALSSSTLTDLPVEVWIAVGIAVLYTLALSLVAVNEASGHPPAGEAYIPGVILDAGAVVLILITVRHADGAALAAGLLLIGGIESALRARSACLGRTPTPPFIGALVRIMITLQAAWIVFGLRDAGGVAILIAVAVMLLMRGAAEAASRRFYGS